MSTCIEKLPHSCGTSDALQVFKNDDGNYTGFCFSCNNYVPDPYNGRPKRVNSSTKKDPTELIETIVNLPIVVLEDRKLDLVTAQYFLVRSAFSEETREPSCRFFPYFDINGELVGYKAKTIEKQIWSIPTIKGAMPFGWKQACETGAKKLFITEGEEDCMALFQALRLQQKGTQYERLIPAVISLRNGAAGARKEMASLLKDIRRVGFQQIVLCFDMDEPGRKAADEVSSLIRTASIVELPEKDANECVIKGKSQALAKAALFRSSVAKNTRLIPASTLFQKAAEPTPWGLSWPWKNLTQATRGLYFGKTYYIGSGVKMGKGVVSKAIAAHLLTEHKMKIAMANFEEYPLQTIRLMAGQIAGQHFHDPNVEFDKKAYEEAVSIIDDNLLLIDSYQEVTWDTLDIDISEAHGLGAKAIFIDPITSLTPGHSAAEVNNLLLDFSAKLAIKVKDLEMIAFIFCHLKAPTSGDPHEKGGSILSNQFAGSRAMMRTCNCMIGLEGNKDPSLPIEERNRRKLIVLENREFGSSPYDETNLYWNYHTGLFEDLDLLEMNEK